MRPGGGQQPNEPIFLLGTDLMRQPDLYFQQYPPPFRPTRRSFLTAALYAVAGCARAENRPSGETLRIGVDVRFPPYSFYDDNRRIIGLDPALAREACRRIGVLPIFVPVPWNQKDEYLASGRIDCLWSCFSMNGREAQYQWIPYLYSRHVVVVPQTSSIKRVADLAGCAVAVQASTLTEEFFLSHPQAPRVEELFVLPSTSEAFLSLRNEYAQAAAGHEAVLTHLMREVPGTYRILEEALLEAKIGVAFPLNGRRLRLFARLERELAHMAEEGETARLASGYDLDASKVVLMPEEKTSARKEERRKTSRRHHRSEPPSRAESPSGSD